ncbi:hypothetical protein ABPG75_003202 [Micractinium tetrahymenae]
MGPSHPSDHPCSLSEAPSGLSCGAPTPSSVSDAQCPSPLFARSLAASSTSCKAARGTMAVPKGCSFHSLPDSTVLAILRLLPPLERRAVVPMVCKRFAALAAASTDLCQQVQLSLPADLRQSVSLPDLYAWFVRREGLVRSLHVNIGTSDAWAPLLALLGVAGRGLEHLRVAGDGQSCAVAGCTAPWLALTPNLRSLELDDVCDHSIGEALWPPGLTRLELSYCGEEGLYSIPTHVGELQQLHTLVLNCAMFDNELTLDRLAACTNLQRLDLSNCCLSRVPRVLASLPRLTSLTLNENDALGAGGAALEPLAALTQLQVLEMRECGLRAVPSSVSQLTNMRSLLLGYNSMAQRPCIPDGPYLAGLRVLAMSDASGFQDDTPFDVLLEPLAPAAGLEVLRINRCMGLQLTIEDVGRLVAGKPRFRKLEFTADMLSDPRDLQELRRRHPHVNFKAVD